MSFVLLPVVPDRGVDWVRLPIALVTFLVAGFVAGYVVGVVAELVPPVVAAFALLIGLAVGGFGLAGVLLARLRNGWVVALLSLLGAGVGLATMAHLDYQRAVQAERDEVAAVQAEPDIGPWLAEQMPRPLEGMSFFEYLHWVADNGVTLYSAHIDEEQGIELRGASVWGLWGVELLLAFGVALLIARRQAVQLFERSSGQWLKRRQRVRVAAEAVVLFRQLLPGVAFSDGGDKAAYDVVVYVVPKPREDSLAVIELLRVASPSARAGSGKRIARFAIAHSELAELLATLAPDSVEQAQAPSEA